MKKNSIKISVVFFVFGASVLLLGCASKPSGEKAEAILEVLNCSSKDENIQNSGDNQGIVPVFLMARQVRCRVKKEGDKFYFNSNPFRGDKAEVSYFGFLPTNMAETFFNRILSIDMNEKHHEYEQSLFAEEDFLDPIKAVAIQHFLGIKKSPPDSKYIYFWMEVEKEKNDPFLRIRIGLSEAKLSRGVISVVNLKKEKFEKIKNKIIPGQFFDCLFTLEDVNNQLFLPEVFGSHVKNGKKFQYRLKKRAKIPVIYGRLYESDNNFFKVYEAEAPMLGKFLLFRIFGDQSNEKNNGYMLDDFFYVTISKPENEK